LYIPHLTLFDYQLLIHNYYNCLEAISDLPTMPVSGKPAKLREAQLQLQRKLQQREHIKDQKHRHLDIIIQVYNV